MTELSSKAIAAASREISIGQNLYDPTGHQYVSTLMNKLSRAVALPVDRRSH